MCGHLPDETELSYTALHRDFGCQFFQRGNFITSGEDTCMQKDIANGSVGRILVSVV